MTPEQINAANGQLFEAMDAVQEVVDATGDPALAQHFQLVETLMGPVHSALADLSEGEDA